MSVKQLNISPCSSGSCKLLLGAGKVMHTGFIRAFCGQQLQTVAGNNAGESQRPHPKLLVQNIDLEEAKMLWKADWQNQEITLKITNMHYVMSN